jgi:hypothetical protein
MNAFLYYVPGHVQQTITPADVNKAGLSYAFPNSTPAFCNAMPGSGPDGSAGAIWTDSERYQYDKARQTWEKHGTAGYWVGVWNDAKPGPGDLEKPDALPGYSVNLGDGNEWTAPLARSWAESDSPDIWVKWSNRLPRVVKFDTSEAVVKAGDCPGSGMAAKYASVVDKYADLWAIAEADLRYREQTSTPEDDALFSGTRLWLTVLRILNFNYRLGPVECNLLGLFTTGSFQSVLDALGDWVTWREMIQKKIAETQGSSPSVAGEKVTLQTTDRPLQTC